VQAQIRIGVSVRVGPPPLPAYEQPLCPGPGYIWTPGYWAYGQDNYYWVPGAWVMPPTVGLLWTPGYWGWSGGLYIWHAGYWGPHVGFYGGVHYGYGYDGIGYEGGYWRHGVFFYNRSVNHIDERRFHDVYDHHVDEGHWNRVSYNGGEGGIHARPSREQEQWARDRHFQPTPEQLRHRDDAARGHGQWTPQAHDRPGFDAARRPDHAGSPNHEQRFAAPQHENARSDNRGDYRGKEMRSEKPVHPIAARPKNAPPKEQKSHPSKDNRKPDKSEGRPR
jgi:WXXGXW repeat (2 copies)